MSTQTPDFKARYEARLAKAKEWQEFWLSEEQDAISRPASAEANVLVETLESKLQQIESGQVNLESPVDPTVANTPSPEEKRHPMEQPKAHGNTPPVDDGSPSKTTQKLFTPEAQTSKGSHKADAGHGKKH